MAEGRVDMEMTDARNYSLPENYDRDFNETSFSNLGFEDNRQYNTSYNSNLTDAYEEPGNPPSAELVADSLRSAALADAFDSFKFTTDRVEALDKSLSKTTEWKYTKTGLNKISPKIYLIGSKIFYMPQEIKSMPDNQIENLVLYTNPDGSKAYLIPLNKNNGAFYSENGLKGKCGAAAIDRL